MIYYRCSCGKHELWGSIPPAMCETCEECGSTLDSRGYLGEAAAPHQWRQRFNRYTGTAYLRCVMCGERKEQHE